MKRKFAATVPAWTLFFALAAGIGISAAAPVIFEYWRVLVVFGGIALAAYGMFRKPKGAKNQKRKLAPT